MSTSLIFDLVLIIVCVDFFFDQILNFINLSFQKNTLPSELADIYSEEKFKKSQAYFRDNTLFGFISSAFVFIVLVVILMMGSFGMLYDSIHYTFHPIYSSLLFFGILWLSSDLITLPFSIYKTFVLEEKYGFNKITPLTFIKDKLKGYGLGIVIGGMLAYVLLFLILRIGEEFWIWFWIIISVFIVMINIFYTSLIVPMFNKLTPLQNGTLKDSIYAYSVKVNFPLDNIFVIDGSKRSSKANAFFSGIGSKKKIVLYDTLIENHSQEELVAVLAHEVGHFKKKHVLWGLILSVLQTGIMLYILSKFIFSTVLSKAMGADALSVAINLVAFGMLYSPISAVTGILMNKLSRKHEYEADAFAAMTYKSSALQSALKKLSSDNLSNLTPHPAYVFVHYSHPPLLARLRNLMKY